VTFARAGVVARREVRETFTDWRILLPMFILAFLFPIVLVSGTSYGLPYMNRIDPLLAAEKASLFGATMAAFFPISFSLIIALESFSGEKERNTLEALLATPVSDVELFLGKFMAVLAPPTILSIIGLVVYTVGMHLSLDIPVYPDFLLLALILAVVEALVMVSAAVVVSSQTGSVKAANLMASFIILPVALVVQGEIMLLILGYGHILWLIVIEFILIAIVLMRMGIQLFNREDILIREGDNLNLRSVVQQVARLWRRTPGTAFLAEASESFSLLRLYTTDIPQILGSYKGPLALVACMFVGGGLVGYFFALGHPLDIAAVNLPPVMEQRFIDEVGNSISVTGIFFHNLRTLIMAGLLSIISFGVIGLMFVILTSGAIGFLAGEASTGGLDITSFLVAFILPHGVLEIPALIIAGALNLWLGMNLMTVQRGQTLGEGLLLALVNWVKGAALFIPLLFLAAVVEVKITPQIVLAIYGG